MVGSTRVIPFVPNSLTPYFIIQNVLRIKTVILVLSVRKDLNHPFRKSGYLFFYTEEGFSIYGNVHCEAFAESQTVM
jgi:hypothetical protein